MEPRQTFTRIQAEACASPDSVLSMNIDTMDGNTTILPRELRKTKENCAKVWMNWTSCMLDSVSADGNQIPSHWCDCSWYHEELHYMGRPQPSRLEPEFSLHPGNPCCSQKNGPTTAKEIYSHDGQQQQRQQMWRVYLQTLVACSSWRIRRGTCIFWAIML